MTVDGRRLGVHRGGVVEEKTCPRGHLSWRRVHTRDVYRCEACRKQGRDSEFKSLQVREKRTTPARDRWWVEILEREQGLEVLESDESPRDVYERLNATEGQQHEV